MKLFSWLQGLGLRALVKLAELPRRRRLVVPSVPQMRRPLRVSTRVLELPPAGPLVCFLFLKAVSAHDCRKPGFRCLWQEQARVEKSLRLGGDLKTPSRRPDRGAKSDRALWGRSSTCSETSVFLAFPQVPLAIPAMRPGRRSSTTSTGKRPITASSPSLPYT